MKKVFVGIDPGNYNVGYSVLLLFGEDKEPQFLKSGVLKIEKSEKFKFKVIYEYFYDFFLDLKKSYFCEIVLCVESQFVYKNPVSSFLIVSVKAIFILLAQQFLFSILEIPPKKIKKIVSGKGGANKLEVQDVISNFFSIEEFVSFDESDAMAISFAAAILEKNF